MPYLLFPDKAENTRAFRVRKHGAVENSMSVMLSIIAFKLDFSLQNSVCTEITSGCLNTVLKTFAILTKQKSYGFESQVDF